MITPEILKQVKAIELRTRGLVGTLFAGEYRSVFRGQGMEFAEVRAYEPGDDFRSIDWNVSARLASPYVKTFTEERELTLMLLVDQSGSTRFGEPVTIGEVTISSGDYLIGDRDGIVIIPGAIAAEVVTKTEEVMQTENKVRTAILSGMDPQEAYLRFGKF